MTTQQDTAKTIFAQLLANGFSRGTAAGILGNAQAESGIIADRWEGDRVGNMAGGYGLLQWTPASKLIDWAGSQAKAAQLQTQINRIIYEVNNGVQFAKPGQSFRAWVGSNITPEQAADDFVRYYERPAVVNSTTRQQFARQWYNYLAGTGASSAPVSSTGSVTVNRDVKSIQKLVGATQDGIYGPDTTAKVKAWQAAHGLTADGIWGPASDAKGFPKATAPATPKAPPFPLPGGYYYGPKSGPVQSVSGEVAPYGGANGAAGLKQWQQQMKNRGNTITVDGKYGPQTQSLAKNFQKQVGLTQDGLIGTQTWSAAWTAPVTSQKL